MKNTKKGFTLIELLVVIAIIGILASVVLASLSTARNKGKDASAKASMSSARASAEIYYSGAGANSYGTAGTGTITTGGTASGLTGVCNDTDVKKLVTATAAQTGTTASCVVGLSGGSYVTYAVLNNPTANSVFCIDSSGFAGETLTAGLVTTITAAVSCK